MPEFDFKGYATRNDLKCSDGRTIRKNAFAECDGATVPLVWAHKHDDPAKVLGHAILENCDDGVIAYGYFNETPSGRNAKELVRHGDIKALSIFANQLVQKGGDVLHGMIREVSLVLAGANPGARIEDLSFEHSYDEDCDDFEALIFNGENIVIEHAEPEKEEEAVAIEESEKEMAHEEKEEPEMAEEVVKTNEEVIEHEDETVADVFNGMSEKQKNVVYYMIGKALEEKEGANESDDEEEKKVAHNLFEGDDMNTTLAHSAIREAMKNVIADGPKYGSLKKSYEAHKATDEVLMHDIDTTGMTLPELGNAAYKTNFGYGINGVEFLFPEARELNNPPEFLKRDTEWVDMVLGGVKKAPFSRIKTTFANITEDDARAKGYLKGNQKKDEFFSLMKRITTPTTIYKKQKFDRDDIIDITDMNVVAWIKTEMRMMLNEELARAIMIGDGRSISSDDKINEGNIRPIVSDANLFTVKKVVTPGANDEETAKNIIKMALKARKEYKGSGNPTFYTTEDWLTSMLLVEDGIGRRLYDTEVQLASAIRARRIVTMPVMEGYKNDDNQDLIGIFVNLTDYTVGTDKGGEVNMFDDFDIDFNQFKYLIETRCSGALTKPYSAIALFKGNASSTTTT